MGRIVIPRPRLDRRGYQPKYRRQHMSRRHKFGPNDINLLMKVLDTAVAVGGKVAGAVGSTQMGPQAAEAQKLADARQEKVSAAIAQEESALGRSLSAEERYQKRSDVIGREGAVRSAAAAEGAEAGVSPHVQAFTAQQPPMVQQPAVREPTPRTGRSVIPGGRPPTPPPETVDDENLFAAGFESGRARKEALLARQEAESARMPAPGTPEHAQYWSGAGQQIAATPGWERSWPGMSVDEARSTMIEYDQRWSPTSPPSDREVSLYLAERGIQPERGARQVGTWDDPIVGGPLEVRTPETAWASAASMVRQAESTGNEEGLEEAQRIYIDVLDGVYGEVDDARRREIATTPEFAVVRQRAHAQALVDRAAETAERGFSANDEALLSEAEGLYIDALNQGQPAAMRRRVSGTDTFKRLREWANARDATQGATPVERPGGPRATPAGPSAPTPPAAPLSGTVVDTTFDRVAAGGDHKPAVKAALQGAIELQSIHKRDTGQPWPTAWLRRQSLGTLQALGAFATTPERRAQLMEAIRQSPDVQPTSVSDLLGMGKDHIARAQAPALTAMKGAKGFSTDPKTTVDLARRLYDLQLAQAQERRTSELHPGKVTLQQEAIEAARRKASLEGQTQGALVRQEAADATWREQRARSAKAKADKLTRVRNRRGSRGGRDDQILAYTINFNNQKEDYDARRGAWSDEAIVQIIDPPAGVHQGALSEEVVRVREKLWRKNTGPFAGDSYSTLGQRAKQLGASKSVVKVIAYSSDDAAVQADRITREARLEEGAKLKKEKAKAIPASTLEKIAKLKGVIAEVEATLKAGGLDSSEEAKLNANLLGHRTYLSELNAGSGVISPSQLKVMAGE